MHECLFAAVCWLDFGNCQGVALVAYCSDCQSQSRCYALGTARGHTDYCIHYMGGHVVVDVGARSHERQNPDRTPPGIGVVDGVYTRS